MCESGQWPGSNPPLVGYALVRVAHLLTQRLDRRLAELGLSVTGFGVLFQLQHDPEVSSAELARRVMVTPQSVGPLLGRLERAGLVDREPTGPPGARIITHITEPGRRRLVEAMALAQAVEDDLVAGFSPAHRIALGQQLWDMLGGMGSDRNAGRT